MRIAKPRADLYAIVCLGLLISAGHPVGYWFAGARVSAWAVRALSHRIALRSKLDRLYKYSKPVLVALVDITRSFWHGIGAVWFLQLALKTLHINTPEQQVRALEKAVNDGTAILRSVTGWQMTLVLLLVIFMTTWWSPRLKLLETFQTYKKQAGRISSFLLAATSFTFFSAQTLDAGPPHWVAKRAIEDALARLHLARREILAAEHDAAEEWFVTTLAACRGTSPPRCARP